MTPTTLKRPRRRGIIFDFDRLTPEELNRRETQNSLKPAPKHSTSVSVVFDDLCTKRVQFLKCVLTFGVFGE